MKKNRPNILLFLTDDHGQWASGCYGNSELKTPHLDRLAQEGVLFKNAFTPCPVCSPARACVMTGKTPSQVGVHDWLAEKLDEVFEQPWLGGNVTLPELLKDSGYRCGLSGKWHLEEKSNMVPKGLDWHFGLGRHQGGHNGESNYYLNGEEIKLEGNKSRIITDHAIEYLENCSSDQPFFLNVGYIATHSPYSASAHDPQVTKLYEEATFRDIVDYESHPWVRNEGTNQVSNLTDEQLKELQQGYYAAVTEIDREVGRIYQKLEELGQLDNTIIIYTSDHGCSLGQNGFLGKGNSTRPLNMYEVSIKVPLLVRGREWHRGKEMEHCVDHYDLFQTICEVAGVDLKNKEEYPGKSYLQFLKQSDANNDQDGENLNWRESRYGEYGDLRMVRTPEYKWVKRYPEGPDDLFDLKQDPKEKNNLAQKEEYQSIKEQLNQELEDWYQQYNNPQKSGLRVKELPSHNPWEAWRDGIREARGLQIY